jgi:hypothetical protein
MLEIKPMTDSEIKAAMKVIDPQLLDIDKQTFVWAVRYMEDKFKETIHEYFSTQLQNV